MSDAERLDEILAQDQPDDPPSSDRMPESELKLNDQTGEGTLAVTVEGDRDPQWDDELRFIGVDPDDWEVYGSYIEVRSWDAPVGRGEVRRLRYIKARIRPRQDHIDSDALLAMIRETQPQQRQMPLNLDRADVVCLSDWQLGKAGEAGGGTEQTVQRVVDTIGMVQDRHDEMRRAGKRAGTLVLAGMGDIIEKCFGHYPAQRFVVDLNEREQRRTARHLLLKALTELAPLYDDVVTFSVASNHGENRDGGKAATDESDSADLELWESIGEYVSAAPDKFGHVAVHVPSDPLVYAAVIAGQPTAFTHGHKATSGGNTPMAKLWQWWADQRAGDNPVELPSGHVVGNMPAGRANVLVGAHYHHFYMREQQGRTLLACPALDGGSRWFTDTRGVWSLPGTLTFTLDAGERRPVDVQVLAP